MPVEFTLPDVGEGLTEAEVVTWLVEPGDPVSEDQPVAEVETDKAVVEVPSPVDGRIAQLHAEEGEMVAVGDVLVTFEVEGDVDEAELEIEPEVADEDGAGGAGGGVEGAAEVEGEAASGAGEGEAASGAGEGGRVFAAPSARRLARELGVDISRVDGSGPGGRVTERDVRAAAESASASERETESEAESEAGPEPEGEHEGEAEGERDGEAEAEAGMGTAEGGPTEATGLESADRDRTLAAPATRRIADELDVDLDAVPAVEERDGEAFVTPEAVREYAAAQRAAREAEVAGEPDVGVAGRPERAEQEERVAYKGIRQTIGQAMERSKYTAPHVTHHDEFDATELAQVRSDLKTHAEEQDITFTYLPLIVKAVVAALKRHPILNSTLDEETEEIVKKFYYNVGIAVATDAGLMVPVVRDADGKDMLQIASEINELAEKAKSRSIAREEMQGGTFTITNFGAIGGEYATPIINYPETAVLGLGEIRERPRVVRRESRSVADGPSGDTTASEVVPRRTLPISLSIDHRVIDGADAARFANTLKRYLENPHLLLLE